MSIRVEPFLYRESEMLRSVLSISLILLTCSVCVSLANTNTISQPPHPTASHQIQTTDKKEPIDGHLYEFNYTLDFAREVGFRKIVELLEEENYPAALQALDEKTGAGFQWSTEATNGYKYGFFAEALKGVCLEKMGEVVKAYRLYQNARYYCDEEKVSMLGTPFPAPKLEVYVGIGRMCNEAGRWTDSLNYLDAARMEAAEYKNIAIAADRDMIKRAVTIGEYSEANTLYKDLSDFHILLRDEYVENAEINFQTYNDSAGFKSILDGITFLGIDNSKGLKDPLLACFLCNIQRANKDNISYFYELMGNAILTSRAHTGDEEYIASLMNLRFLMCKVFDYLNAENDLEKAKTCVESAKRYLSTKQNKTYYKKKVKGSTPLHKKQKDNQELVKGELNTIEDMVMAADVELMQKEYISARKKYLLALTNYSGKSEIVEYNGFNIKEAIVFGLLVTGIPNVPRLEELLNVIKEQSNIHTITSYGKALLNNVKESCKYDNIIKDVIEILPKNNSLAIKLLENSANNQLQAGKYNEYVNLCREIMLRTTDVKADMFHLKGLIHARDGNNNQAFSDWIYILLYNSSDIRVLRQCYQTIGWGKKEDWIRFFYIKSTIPLLNLTQPDASFANNYLNLKYNNVDLAAIVKLYNAINICDTNEIYNSMRMIKMNGFSASVADSLLANEMKNNAFELYHFSLIQKYGHLQAYPGLCDDIDSWGENRKIQSMLNYVDDITKNQYTHWINGVTNRISKTIN